MKLQYAAFSHLGCHRSNNEDNYWLPTGCLPELHETNHQSGTILLPKACCFGVFDGMGGGIYGETASYFAAAAMQQLAEGNGDFQEETASCSA